MILTALGAAVSDGLGDGRVVSGVGGQYNFVSMAHALPEARSVVCVRSTRTARGVTTSNILWSYPHVTIPRHLRDIVVTEYGIADLRGKTDREVVSAVLAVTDARFQDALVGAARRAGKLPRDYQVPPAARANSPAELARRLRPWRAQEVLSELPFGSDLTSIETTLTRALRYLGGSLSTWPGRTELLRAFAFQDGERTRWQEHLQRMSLLHATSVTQRAQRRLLLAALQIVSRE
jgi:hypothetical protein